MAVNGNIGCHQITERHAIRYFEDAAKTRSPRSLQIDHTVLNQLFEWMRKTKRMPLDMDPMAGRRRPKTRHRERERVHVSKFPHLLDVAGKQDARNRMIVAVLIYTLARDSEVTGIRIGDVDLDGGWLRVRIHKSHTEDLMPICSELDAELRRWLTTYAEELDRPLLRSDYLLPRRQSVGILREGEAGFITGHDMIYLPDAKLDRCGRIARDVLREAGFATADIDGKSLMEGAHTIRRSGARALFDRLAAEGYDRSLRIVQSMLHHSSVSITEHYIGVTADRRGRDEIIRGKPMFATEAKNVTRLIG
jgi:integrase